MNAETEQSSQNSVFRTPNTREVETQAPISKDEPVIPREGSEPTPKELSELGRPPYLVDLLEAGPAYKTFEVESQSKEIDSFINSELERKGLDDTRENYKKVLDEIYKNINPTDSVYNNIENLLDYIRIQQKLLDVLEEKKKFEAMDPLEMTAKQLEKYINGKA